MEHDLSLPDRVVIDPTVLRRFDMTGPRYTSYPTADRFAEPFEPDRLERALQARGAEPGGGRPLSLYVHIPFCESVCYYCACNKVITRHHERATEYLQALDREVDMLLRQVGGRPTVSQLHFGGGSPTFLSDDELSRWMTTLRQRFEFTDDAEVSIEVDPRTVDAARLAHLRALGFDRLSFGVQDFDPEVQRAVHREQSMAMVQALMVAARGLGFRSINADLIYGLPKQTPESFARTVAQIGELRPDRIALYGYAHLPERFKPQRRIDEAALPSGAQKLSMLAGAIEGFQALGYEYIGMDHFALPGDSLAVARREGRLHRNFQGYSTQPDCDLVGLGVSAISRVGAHYAQNVKSLPDYYERLRQGRLPVERGLTLDRDDLIRRDVIMALMCQGRLDFPVLDQRHLVDSRRYFDAELQRLQPLAADGLVEVDASGIRVTPLGWYFIRAVVMVFDRHLGRRRDASEGPAPRFSRIV